MTAWLQHQQNRFMRPDGGRYLRPDGGRYLSPERKWDGQPRIEEGEGAGQFTFGTQSEGGEGGGDAGSDGGREADGERPRVYIYTPRTGDGGGEEAYGDRSDGLLVAASASSEWPFNNHPPLEDPPEIPQAKPSRSSSAALRAAAIWLGRALAVGAFGRAALFIGALGTIAWARGRAHEIVAYLDPPRSMKELEDAVNVPRRGTELHHHKMEQHVSKRRGLSKSEIDAPGNRVRIPTLKHYEITSWYQTQNESFGGLTPRQYLADKAPDEHARVGRDALLLFKVLKP